MSLNVIRSEVLSRLEGVRPAGGGRYMACCPIHGDKRASMSVSPGDTQLVVFRCHVCLDEVTAQEIADAAGIPWDLISKPRDRSRDDPWAWMPCVKDGHTWTANYLYRDQHNNPVIGVGRCDQKCFTQFRIDPTGPRGRRFRITLPDGAKAGAGLIYRLPEILDADALRNVYIVEGEKDANRLWSMGVPATCNPGGAGKWTPQHAEWLHGRDVVIVADRDEAGRKHAVNVAETLMDIADSIEILQAAHGKDFSDHVDAGGTLATLISVAEPKKLTGFGVPA